MVDVYDSVVNDYPDVAHEFERLMNNGDLEIREWSTGYGKTCTGLAIKGTKKPQLYGFGREVQRKGGIKEGYFLNGMLYGLGNNFTADGQAYIGNWKGGYYHGMGKFHYEDSSYEEG